LALCESGAGDPRTTQLESVPVSGLKSRPPQPVPDERDRYAPGSKNAP
jgi:hypothetical protein